MGNMIRLALAYIRYYKKQTLTLFLGIAVSAALLTGIGSLLESGRIAARENARTEYGDWHYTTRGDAPWVEDFLKNPQGKGYTLEACGTETVRKIIEEPYAIQMVYADQNYLDMMGRKVIEGTYPEKENEIAMDAHTLRNLNVPEELGSEVTLDGETFVLSGILTEMPEKLPSQMGDFMQVFVNDTLDYGKNGTFLYLKFKENGNVYRQAEAFCHAFGISGDLYRNNGLAQYVGSETPANALEIIKTGLKNKNAGIPYIWGQLNASGGLMEKTVLAALGVFGIFIIYSLFQISVSRRMAGYSVMQTMGMTDSLTFGTLFSELFLIFIVGYPAGCMVGNGIAAFIYGKTGRIFIMQNAQVHVGSEGQALENAVGNLPDAGAFHTNWKVIFWGAVFLFAVLFLISQMLVRRMKKATIRQLMARDTGAHGKNRKIYSIRHENMAGILTKKFMFSRKGMFLGILFSLSVGSIIFLSAAYVTENTKRNNELTFKADDGLGSDIQIYEDSDDLADTIPKEAVNRMKDLDGVNAVYPVRYLLGEIAFNDNTFLWPEFYPELGYAGYEPDAELMEKYNGIAVQTGENDFSLKVNIYGYEDEMLLDLNDYLLEGTIDPEQMRRENSVILKTIMDGQGNYDAIDVHPGDSIQLKTVSSTEVPKEAYQFLGQENWYRETHLKVSAVSSRQLAKVHTFIGDSYDSVVNIIMTNEQMEKNFGVSDYQTISISLTEEAQAEEISGKLGEITSGIRRCIVKDYSRQIAAQNLYLTQKMLFFYGIAGVLFGISILHIMNSMQYLVIERRHEFGILRAMGITDAGFCKMLSKEGLRYGIYSGIVITVLFFFVQKILYFFMLHVYLYVQPRAFLSWRPFAAVIGLNILICVAVVLLSGRAVLKEQIVDVVMAE